MHSSLSLAVGYNRVVTHRRRPCNDVVATLAKDKTPTLCSRCRTPASILSSAALGGPILQRGLRFAPSLRDSGLWVTMPGGGTRPGEEVKDGSHSDNRCCGNRGGVAPTAAPLRSRAGILRGSGLYTVLGRAFCTHPARRGASHCALEALRMIVNGATMTTPTQWGGHGGPAATPPCSAHRLLSWGRSSCRTPPRSSDSSLRPTPMPKALVRSGPCGGRIIPDDTGILRLEHLALSGWGYADFHVGVNFRFTEFCEVRIFPGPC
jgi:hypothetical protein